MTRLVDGETGKEITGGGGEKLRVIVMMRGFKGSENTVEEEELTPYQSLLMICT